MKKTFLLLVAVLILAGIALAQEHPALTAQVNSVYVGADGRFEADPDTAIISFSISPQEDTAAAAYAHAAKAADQVRSILRANGIDPKAAEMGFFSVQPMYDCPAMPTLPVHHGCLAISLDEISRVFLAIRYRSGVTAPSTTTSPSP